MSGDDSDFSDGQADSDHPEKLSRLSAGAGTVCFLDAIPVGSVKLEAEIMTPHYANWTEKKPPGDWMSPSPIPFLAVAKQTSFLFGVFALPNPNTRSNLNARSNLNVEANVAAHDLELVLSWLEAGLKWAGAGAKTATGYGRFIRNQEKTQELVNKIVQDQRKRREKVRKSRSQENS